MLFVARISAQNFILCNQSLRTFCEKDFVAEFHRCLYLAALNQIGVRFKDGIDLLGGRNLLSFQYPATRLIDDTISQSTVLVDLLAEFVIFLVGQQIFAACLAGLLEHLSCALHNLLGDVDELAIFPGLLGVPLADGHPLDFLHPAPRRPGAIVEPLDTAQ